MSLSSLTFSRMDSSSLLDSSSVRTSIKGLFRNTITSSDRHTISQFLLDAEQEIQRHDAEINRLRTAIHLLETKKLGLKKSMDRCHSLLSPVHRLPTEILTEILSIACEENKLCPSTPPNVVKLSRVCGRWWEVICSAPKLWSSITIQFSSWEGKFPVLEKLVRLFLDRSDTQLLKLELDFFAVFTDQDQIDMLPIIHALCDHAARWRVLGLENPPSTFTPSSSRIGMPALQHLKAYEVHPDIFSSLFKNSPCLRTLDIMDDYIDFSSDLPSDLSSHLIKILVVRDAYADAACSYLLRFPVLETLYMHGISFHNDSNRENTEHHFSTTIASLAVEFDTQSALDATLCRLTLPQLTSLQVCGSDESVSECTWPIWAGAAVTDFLSRSSCTLTSLCLRKLPITGDQAITLLEHVPTLVSLEIRERPRTDEDPEVPEPFPNRIITQTFLQRFAVEHEVFRSSHAFLPLLADITFSMREDDSGVEQGMFNAVASRWIPDPAQAKEIGVKCLKSVTITVRERKGGSEEKRWLKALECFRDAGLRLRVDG
ncbi:hypothetical protein AAF712_006800 [Marasmius tenuissimus]|uniref:F-box domain-containing protein n=1 Tax=Marasmius tenuissimus TaxID=585030 RepID=A0ABR2ZXY1_9AGAR